MDFEELKRFIADDMRMQHIYQPVMIRTLLTSEDNEASVKKIVEQFLYKDESQIEYYMKITKEMPGRILRKNGVVAYNSDYFILNTEFVTTAANGADFHV